MIVVERQFSIFSAISRREKVNFQQDDDEVRFGLDQHAELDFNSASSLKQQSVGMAYERGFSRYIGPGPGEPRREPVNL